MSLDITVRMTVDRPEAEIMLDVTVTIKSEDRDGSADWEIEGGVGIDILTGQFVDLTDDEQEEAYQKTGEVRSDPMYGSDDV